MKESDLNKIDNKRLSEILKKSKYSIKCNKCDYTSSQDKAFFTEYFDKKGFFIKCPKCSEKIYSQNMIFDNKIIQRKILNLPKMKIR
jgi:Zn finger protein HypA/HybF involved in hydrogenase expression